MKKILLLLGIMCISSNSVFGYEIYNVPDTPPYAYTFNVYAPGEDKDCTRDYPFSQNELNTVFQAGIIWREILISTQVNPVIYDLKPINDNNAYASSNLVTIAESPYKVSQVNAVLNNRTITSPATDIDDYDGQISVGVGMIKDFEGWSTDISEKALYDGNDSDLLAISLHEVMHTLGLLTGAATYKYDQGDNTLYFSKDNYDPLNIHDYYLRLYTGDPALPFDETKEMKTQNGMAVGEGSFDPVKYSPYFVGANSLKVLTGENDADTAKTAIINNGGMVNYSLAYEKDNPEETIYPKVYGLPIHPMDDLKKQKIDLSHIELRNSFMSHQEFRNWTIPMEAELAYLQDIGYNIELRKYFGKSYYLNNITDTYIDGFSEWNGTSYTVNPSLIDKGIGIHIYGNNNNITQATNDITTIGQGAIGVRVEGVQNTYTLDSSANIVTNGNNSIGLAATWGKDHTINVSNGSSVIANGDNGIAVSFDFGGNYFGKNADLKGSYINFDSEDRKNISPVLETQGALVENFNSSGILEGKKAAIYISDNAYVDNINIGNGSIINGNIISKWNSAISGNAKVMRKNGDNKWVPVNPQKTEEIRFTNLNFAGNTLVNGNIDGSNDIFNTLNMKNTGVLNFLGSEININQLNNTGTVNFNNVANSAELHIQNGSVIGNGLLLFNNGVTFDGIRYIANTVDIGNTFLSILDGNKDRIDISKLNSNYAGLYFDYGDTFVLQNNSDVGQNQITLKQIAVGKNDVDSLKNTDRIKLFEEKSVLTPTPITLDLNSSVNVYYEKNKYTFSQDNTDKSYLLITKTEGSYELADALADATTANYVLSDEDTITKNLGTVQGTYFEISGDEIDVEGHTGLVIDGTINNKTTLKTDIYGASDSNITLNNKANLIIKSEKEDITIGKNGEVALTIDNSSVDGDVENNNLNFAGEIKGLNNNQKNILILSAKTIDFNKIDNVAISTKAENVNINNVSTNTIWQISDGTANVKNDAYLSSDGSNQLFIESGGALNLANNQASNITLSNMTLNSNLNMSVDIDLNNMNADKFVFNNVNDLNTNGYDVNINNINIVNPTTALENYSYSIPFISSEYNNQNFKNAVSFSAKQEIKTPIFKYNMGYSEIGNKEYFTLSRGASSDHKSFNPSVLSSSYGAQLGGYFNQLASYEMGFYNMDTNMLLSEQEKLSLKYRNKYANNGDVLTYDPNQNPLDNKSIWFKPYSAFEKVNISNGGTVENISYGSYVGGNSEIIELKRGWNGQYSLFVGYNGSHQRYDNVSIYQNGGQLGASGYLYKNNFYTGLTASVGASVARGSTMYGNEDFTILSTGIASKTGYNWSLAKGKFIIQPNYLMSYSFVNTFDYTNAAGVRITSDPLNTIQIAPGIKFICNLKNGWQPYLGVTMVWNIIDKTHFRANNVSLPQMSIAPYVQYGIGLKKKWKDRFTGFIQAMITNGGRNGVSLTAGFSWTLGK